MDLSPITIGIGFYRFGLVCFGFPDIGTIDNYQSTSATKVFWEALQNNRKRTQFSEHGIYLMVRRSTKNKIETIRTEQLHFTQSLKLQFVVLS